MVLQFVRQRQIKLQYLALTLVALTFLGILLDSVVHKAPIGAFDSWPTDFGRRSGAGSTDLDGKVYWPYSQSASFCHQNTTDYPEFLKADLQYYLSDEALIERTTDCA